MWWISITWYSRLKLCCEEWQNVRVSYPDCIISETVNACTIFEWRHDSIARGRCSTRRWTTHCLMKLVCWSRIIRFMIADIFWAFNHQRHYQRNRTIFKSRRRKWQALRFGTQRMIRVRLQYSSPMLNRTQLVEILRSSIFVSLLCKTDDALLIRYL